MSAVAARDALSRRVALGSDDVAFAAHGQHSARLGLALVATALLGAASVRGTLADAPRSPEITFGFAAALALVLLATPARTPAWAAPVGLGAAAIAWLWAALAVEHVLVGLVGLAVLAALALLARPADRPLAIGGGALLVATVPLASGGAGPAATLALGAGATGALAFLFLATVRRRARPGETPELLPYACLAAAIVAAASERQLLVVSSRLAPDEVLAALAPPILAALALLRPPLRLLNRWAAPGKGLARPGGLLLNRWAGRGKGFARPARLLLAALPLRRAPRRLRAAGAAGIALAAYLLVAVALLAGVPYGADVVAAPHYAAELLLRGEHPYAAFDIYDALDRFGLSRELATKLEAGGHYRSFAYPAGAIVLVAPFVGVGLADIRWVYVVELVALGVLLYARGGEGGGRSRTQLSRRSAEERSDYARSGEPLRLLVVALLVANGLLLRQYGLGIDPTWALAVAVAWLFFERPGTSAVALGIGMAARQTAWFAVPFYLVAAWRARGVREAAARGVAALATFAALNAPFFITAPRAYLSSVLAPMLEPLEPYGVGLVRLGVAGLTPLYPRGAYLAAAVLLFALLLLLVARRWRELPGAPLTFPLVPLFFAWRALANYFVFLPLFAVLPVGELAGRSAAATDPPAAAAPRARAAAPGVVVEADRRG